MNILIKMYSWKHEEFWCVSSLRLPENATLILFPPMPTLLDRCLKITQHRETYEPTNCCARKITQLVLNFTQVV